MGIIVVKDLTTPIRSKKCKNSENFPWGTLRDPLQPFQGPRGPFKIKNFEKCLIQKVPLGGLGQVNQARGPSASARQAMGPSAAVRQARGPSAAAGQTRGPSAREK